MTTLSAALQARYSTQHILNISNPDNPSASTINTTLIDTLTNDVIADFAQRAWVNLDSTNVNPKHINTAVKGLYLRLLAASGTNTDLSSKWNDYHDELEQVLRSTPRNRNHPRVNYDSLSVNNGEVIEQIQRANEGLSDVPSAFYNAGTASASGTTVTGIGTLWRTSGKVASGYSIGFGTDQPARVSTWYEISSLSSETVLILTSSAGTITSGFYVIVNRSGSNI